MLLKRLRAEGETATTGNEIQGKVEKKKKKKKNEKYNKPVSADKSIVIFSSQGNKFTKRYFGKSLGNALK
jgi:hypothetical protein